MSVLGVDAGQSGVRLRFAQTGETAGAMGVRAADDVQGQLADAVSTLVREAGWSPDTIAVGLTGLTATEATPDLLLDAVPSCTTVLMAHDSVTSLLGALGAREGAVVAAGTGVVTLALGPAGARRVDGHGHMLGDAGSGYWLGRAGIDAVLRAHDGRGSTTALSDSAREAFGPLDFLGPTLQRDPDRVARIAAFARSVLSAADAGDDAAIAIASAGADELATSAAASLERVRADSSAPVSWAGALLTHSLRYRTLFEAALTARRPGATLEPPQGDGLDGAIALVAIRSDSPLYTLVHRAAR